MDLTAEQETARQLFLTGTNLAVEAGAGTGKTSTLVELAHAVPNKRGQYLAFNKAIVLDSKKKMPANVNASTMHSLALRGLDPELHARLGGNRLSPNDRARAMGVRTPIRLAVDTETKVMQPGRLSGIVMGAIRNFCQSEARELTADHFSYIDGIDLPEAVMVDGKPTLRHGYANNNRVRRELLPIAQKFWKRLINPAERALPFDHPHYLKLAQLDGIRIPVDFIMFDEAQDTSPVMADIVRQQLQYGTQLVFVGDSQQAINGFMGAVNAMENVPAGERTWLTQSFRFGPEVAAVANLILADLDAELRIKGLDSIASRVEALAQPKAVLTRTNAVAVERMLEEIGKGTKAHLVGGGSEIAKFAEAAIDLQTKGWTGNPDLACFTSWGQVQEYAAFDEEGSDMALNVKLVDDYGADVILNALGGRMPQERYSDLVISTAHKSKGRQWGTVQLAHDFPLAPSNDKAKPMTDELRRLLYVACTRAQFGLDISRVGYLTDFLMADAQPVGQLAMA